MASSNTEEERLKAEIAKLSGAIQSHKQHNQYHQPYASRGRGYYAAGPSYRGSYGSPRGGSIPGRGRGRGAAVIPPRNRTLILNESASKPSASGNPTSAPTEVPPAAAPTDSGASSSTDAWIKRKSTHNMSLVSASTFQRTEPARLAALEATRKAKAEARSAASQSKLARPKPAKASASVRRGDNMGEVVIDGVVFEFDPSGTKLVKKAVQPSASADESASASVAAGSSAPSTSAVPLKTSINGQEYIRTKRGNLISAELLAKRRAQAKMGRLDKMVGQISAMQATRNAGRSKRSGAVDVQKSRTLCTFFNKTGQCKRGLSCPYRHDSSKIALCPKVLRAAGCTLPKGTCPLSHTPRAERVPHCVHYLRSRHCRNGTACLYTHADLVDGLATKICRDFSEYGWCERGASCEQRHTYECPDFVENGSCQRKGCKLLHILRANDTADKDAEEVKDDDLFVRDDAAAEEERPGKRKRPLMQTELDEEMIPDFLAAEEEEEEQVDWTQSKRSRSTKAFTNQHDFISFADDAESQRDDESGDEEEDDAASVHSDEFELSDGDDEDEVARDSDDDDDEEEEEEESQQDEGQDPDQEDVDDGDAGDDDDDDAVDRDL
ncbi:C3H1-type Zn-finger protein [Moesziomyces antarcticus T-34]|uniref:C3H1-type Zn-finger protein n=1 Tax=Pseudozyma antarctica (strain T-34) TaxID=1151754 RepID=M9M4M1_PSEA3|nr:C3H1-type Zn-finger protein [Moesziomyces antarcticus T-34]